MVCVFVELVCVYIYLFILASCYSFHITWNLSNSIAVKLKVMEKRNEKYRIIQIFIRCLLLTYNFMFQSEGTATIRTRKFMTNRLLCRKQMVRIAVFSFAL